MFDTSSYYKSTVVRERNAVKVEQDLDLRQLGPLGCGVDSGSGTVLNTRLHKPGDTIAVTGTGAVGLADMMAGQISGCTQVIAIDIVDSRLELAQELGDTDVVNRQTEDPVAAVKKLTGGLGVDWAVDNTGVQAVMEDTIQMLALGGTTDTIAVTPQLIDVDTWNDLCVHEQKIVGVHMGDSIPTIDVPRSIELVKTGMFDFDKTEKLVTFDQIHEAHADSRSGQTIKPVLIIDKEVVPGK